jgi:hypothetical protein
MTKPFIYFVIGLASLSLVLSAILTITYSNNKRRIKENNIECKHKIDSLKDIIDEREDEIEVLEEEIQHREIEVMYWGMKYDSLRWKN